MGQVVRSTSGGWIQYDDTETNSNRIISTVWFQYDVSTTTQKLRPTSDISAGSWTPSTGTTLYGVLDEVSVDDADYVTTSTSSTFEVRFDVGGDPVSSIDHIIRYRAKGVSLTAYLYQNTTLIATHSPSITSSFQTFTWTLSAGEADSITDYSNLRIRFTGS
jgi:hypothetical protein